jgi:hypothetical protein
MLTSPHFACLSDATPRALVAAWFGLEGIRLPGSPVVAVRYRRSRSPASCYRLGCEGSSRCGPASASGQEVRASHPRFEGSGRVLDSLRRMPMASGIRLSLACIASRTPSRFQRLSRFSLSGVQLGLRGQVKQAVRWRRQAAALTAQNRRQIIFQMTGSGVSF